VFRNVDQLFNHLASPSEGLGKSSGCAHVKRAAPAVQAKYAAEIASRAWAWRCRVPKKHLSPTGFVLVANHTPNDHRTTTARSIFVVNAPRSAPKSTLRRSWSAIGRF
jgi:hypothetical protein